MPPVGEKVVVAIRQPYQKAALAGLRPNVLHLPVDNDGPAVLFFKYGNVPDLAPFDALAYRVEERLQWDYQRDWPAGQPTPGVKRIAFLRRIPAITRDEFARHWTDVHAPLARRHHPALWRYAQNVVTEPLTPGAPEADGIVELSFRHLSDPTERMYDSAEGAAIIGRDVATFIDVPAGWRVTTIEHVLVFGPSDW
jgi:hypothetical protein